VPELDLLRALWTVFRARLDVLRRDSDRGDIVQTVIIVAAFAAAAIIIVAILVAKAKSKAENVQTQ
jgi:hypothetical protein